MSNKRKNIPNSRTPDLFSEHLYHKNNKIIFKLLVERWLCHKKTSVKESTIIRYQNLIKLYLMPEFGEIPVDEFAYPTLYEFSVKLLQSGGSKGTGLSPKTVLDILSLLHNIFQYAENIGISIPAAHMSIPVKQNKKQMRIFTIAEQKKLLTFLMNDPKQTSLGIQLCFFTGLRIGEICALKWGDILIEEKSIFVHQTMQRLQTTENEKGRTKILISSPKSISSIREIPIPAQIFELIKKAQISSHYPKEAFLLTGSTTKYVEPRTLQYRFKRILLECGIKDANFHAVRHTFATRCIEVGCDVKSLSEILGHSNVNITLNCYVHPPMNLKRQSLDKLSSLFDTI
ncbi:MAG: site-specific integrase [Lachnospiraceae bacterium]|nr:site-specific integrase [Lachnospiraceae bacterium]